MLVWREQVSNLVIVQRPSNLLIQAIATTTVAEKRNPVDVYLDAREALERAGISSKLWRGAEPASIFGYLASMTPSYVVYSVL